MINWDELEEKAKVGVSLTAEQAAVPAYLKSQAEGVEAAGDIFGISTPSVTSFKKGQEDALSGFETQYPGGLFETDDPAGWWKETATLNVLNQVVPYLGYTAGAILQAVPHPVAKGLGVIINSGTFASQYNANFADTLQEHEERAGRPLTDNEKAWAAVVSGGVVALDRLVPGKMAKDVVKKMGGPKAVETARTSLIKRMNAARDNLGTSLKKGGKYVGAKISQEALTEAAQKSLQIGTSQDPSYLATTEGLQSVAEEAAVAGPTAGILSTPGAVLEGTSTNRDIARARKQTQQFNQNLKSTAADIFGKTGIDTGTVKSEWIDTPESAESILSKGGKLLKDKTGLDAPKLLQKAGDVLAYKAPSILVDARDESMSGKAYYHWDNIVKKLMPVGTYSGESGKNKDFLTIKDKYTSDLYRDINNVLNKYAPPRRGQLTQPTLSKELNDYIRAALDDRSKIGSRTDLMETSDLEIIVGKVNQTGQMLQDKTGSGFVKNYLHKPLDEKVIKNNKDAFIDSLLESSKIAYFAAKSKAKAAGREFNPSNFIWQEDPIIAKENATQIADEIILGKDPFIMTSRAIRESMSRDGKGKGKESFEKSRSAEWKGLSDMFRQQDISKVLEQYISKAATRIASAETFGSKNADLLQKELKELEKTGELKQEQADRVWDVYDASHNIYRRDVSEGEQQWRVLSKGLTTVAAVTHLGLATFSSLSELVWIAERAGFVNMLSTLPAALKYTRQGIGQGLSGKRLKQTEGNTVLANLGFNLNPMMNDRLDALFSTDRSQILSMYFRSPFGMFLTQWTNFNRNWAAQAGMSMMNRRAKGLVNGSIDSMDKRRLKNELFENGISMSEFQQLAELSKDDKGNININMIDDAYLNKEFIMDDGTKTRVKDVLHPWVHKIVTDVVVHPTAVNKPLWMSDPSLSTIAQLKTFPIVFGNTVVKRLIRKVKPNACSPDFGLAISVFGMMAAAMAVASIGEEIKDAIRGQSNDSSWIDLGNTAGLFGAFGLGLGSRHGDLTTSFFGPSLNALVNKGLGDMLVPMSTGETSVGDTIGNLGGWFIDGAVSTLGATGKLIFEDEE
jgi:hypothetical protein